MLLHGSAGGRLLLVGVPAQHLAPETTAQPTYRLRLQDAQGQFTEALTGDQPALDGVLSPRGRRLAAVLDGGRLLVRSDPATARVWAARAAPGLAFSPDGERLVFVCGVAPETNICLLDLASRRWRRLTRGSGPEDRPSFSTDGSRVIFVAAAQGVAAMWSVGLRPGAAPLQLTNRGLAAGDIAGPLFVPVPVGPGGALPVGRSLLFDSGEALVSVTRGMARTLALTGALLLSGRKGRALVLRRSSDRIEAVEVGP